MTGYDRYGEEIMYNEFSSKPIESSISFHVNGPEVGTKKFDNLITAAITKWQSKSRQKAKYAHKIVQQANLPESLHSTGQETQIVTLRDAEIQTDDVEAEPVVKEVEWVSKQLDLPDVDSNLDSDYHSDAGSNSLSEALKCRKTHPYDFRIPTFSSSSF